MYDKSQDLTTLISSRICHDLASPLGAIANGLELLELTGLADTPEAALLSDSVKSASARIEFFRMAFGPASTDALVSPALAQRTLTQNFAERKITATWSLVSDCPRPMAKLLFLLTQAIESALPFGGEISVMQNGGTWALSGTGREVRLNPGFWNHLSDQDASDSLQSAQVQFALARVQSTELAVAISVEYTQNTVNITVA